MSWENLDLGAIASTVKNPPPPPVETYTFRLLGVKRNQFDPEKIDFDLVIDEGQYKGRRVFPTLPDPSKYTWAANAAAHLLITVFGETQQNGESPLDAFARVAATQPRLTAPLVHDEWTGKDGTQKVKANIQFFQATAAA